MFSGVSAVDNPARSHPPLGQHQSDDYANAVVDVQPLEQGPQVHPYRVRGDPELGGDLAVAASAADQAGDL